MRSLPDNILQWETVIDVENTYDIHDLTIDPRGEFLAIEADFHRIDRYEIREISNGLYQDHVSRSELRTMLRMTNLNSSGSIDYLSHPPTSFEYQADPIRNLVEAQQDDFGHCFALHPNRDWIATDVRLWDIQSGETILELDGTCPVLFSEDGQLLALGRGYSGFSIYDLDTMTRLGNLSCHGLRYYDSEFPWDHAVGIALHDGRDLAACYNNRFVVIYNVFSGEQLMSLQIDSGHHGLIFNQDGHRLGIIGENVIRIWDFDINTLLYAPIRVGVFDNWWASPDLETWLTYRYGTPDYLTTWDPASDEELSIDLITSPNTYRTSLSVDGHLMAISNLNGLELWQIGEQEPFAVLPFTTSDLHFSADNRYLGMMADAIWLWAVTP